MKISLQIALVAAVSSLALASAAHATITVGGAPSFLYLASTGLDTLGATNPGSYSDGGFTFTYVSPQPLMSDTIINNRSSIPNPTTDPSWTPANIGGYTEITSTDPTAGFLDFGIDVGQWANGVTGNTSLFYEVLGTDLSTVLTAGKITGLAYQHFQTISFTSSDGLFGAVLLSANFTGAQSTFDSTGRTDFLTLDNVGGAIANLPAVAGVPEPASWALMLMGFGSLGAMLRRRRHILQAATA